MADLAALAARIRNQIGHDRVVDDRDVVASYETDWTGRYRGQAGLVVRPVDSDELATAISLITSAGVGVVPQGGNTGLVGGSIPRHGEVVVSTRRMTDIAASAAPSEVVVSAGVTLSEVQHHAAGLGMGFAVDIASRESATIGGMIATNAGGIHVVRWGRMRAQVLGLEVALRDGDLLDDLERPPDESPNFVDLFAGSEGTLGIISRARLRLIPEQRHKVVALLSFMTLDHGVAAAAALKANVEGLDAVEYFGADTVDLVTRHRGLRPPFGGDGGSVYILVEVSGSDDCLETLQSVLDDVPGIVDSAVGVDPGPQRALWELRESVTEAISAVGVPQKYDVWLTPSAVPEFNRSLVKLSEESGVEIVLFGHVGEGHLHVNVLGLRPEDRSMEERIYRLVLDLGGSPISEHGVGSTKLRWHREILSSSELERMQAVKRQFDPANLLNPGVLVPSVEEASHPSGEGRH